jgi:DNA-binding CsgD family transcriptional regulator
MHMPKPATLPPLYLDADHTLLDRIPKPIFVIDADRTIRSCNVSGRSMLASASAPLHTIGRRLHGNDGLLDQAIAKHTAALRPGLDVDAPDQFFPVASPFRCHWVAVSVSFLCGALGTRDSHPKRHVLLVVHPVASIRPVAPALLQIALTLTRSEAQVAALIYAGHTVRETAQKIGVGPSTVKSHLHHIFNKNRISKQTELVHLVAGLASV